MTEKEFLQFLKDECNIELTESQRMAVLAVDGPVALIAVPGSGKTLTLISRMANLILNHQVNPNRILALTFSRAAANDMKERFNERFGRLIYDKVNFSTLHSFAYAVVREYCFRTGKKYELIEGFSNISTSKNTLLRSLYRKYNYEAINDDKLEELSGTISYIKNLMLPFEEIKKSDFNLPVPSFEEIFKEYESFKTANNLIDFDDMLTICHSVFKTNEDMLNKYRTMYDYVMLDEAQDTSKIQHEIIKLIVSAKYNIFVVGDDDQSIYSWRGAFPQELLKFKDSYGGKSKVLFMEQNFRSTKAIVSTANQFIKSNRIRYKKNLFTENQHSGDINLLATENEFTQVDFIIDNLKKEGVLKNRAILFRNNLSSVILVDELVRRGVPFYIKDAVPAFFNHWIIRDFLAFFEMAENLSNLDAFKTIYYKMKTYIQKKDIMELKLSNPRESVFLALMRNDNYSPYTSRLKEFEDKFKVLATMKPLEGIGYIQGSLNYREYLLDSQQNMNYSLESMDAIISTFKNICKGLDSFRELKEKLAMLQGKMENSKRYKGENVLTLSTMHSSKGLEFNKVFVIDLNEGTIPSGDSLKKAQDGDFSSLEEERRLFYVAITRAKEDLYLIYPEKRNGNKVNPSRFFAAVQNIIKPSTAFSEAAIEEKTTINININVGDIIKHKAYGKGEIIEVKGDYITALFSDGSTKVLSAKVCIVNKIIEV